MTFIVLLVLTAINYMRSSVRQVLQHRKDTAPQDPLLIDDVIEHAASEEILECDVISYLVASFHTTGNRKSQRTPEPCCNGQPVTGSHHLIGQSTSLCNSRRVSDPQASMIHAIGYNALHPVYYGPVIKLGLCRSGRHLVSLLDSEL